MGDTLTEDDVKDQIAKAVADAIGPLEAQLAERDTKIAELTDKIELTDADKAVAEAVAAAVAPLNDKIADLQKSLDDEVVARGAAEAEHKALADKVAADDEAASVAQRREARIAAVKDTGIWPEDSFDETVEANKDRIDRWAAKSDEDFADLLDGWKVGKPAKEDQGNGDLPTKRTALTDVASDGVDAKSPVSRLLATTIASPSQTSS